VAWNVSNFVGFQLILSLVGVFKAKPDPAICRGKPVERLVRLFELKSWREMNIILARADYGLSRLWVDRRSETTEWTDTALQSLWHAVQETVRTFGEGWSIWHAVALAAAKKPLPHKLQQEEVPITALRASKEGGYHWGKYVSSLDVTNQCHLEPMHEAIMGPECPGFGPSWIEAMALPSAHHNL
jgi:hypothetical protein